MYRMLYIPKDFECRMSRKSVPKIAPVYTSRYLFNMKQLPVMEEGKQRKRAYYHLPLEAHQIEIVG